MPYINVIEHSQAEGQLKSIYDDLVEKRGKLAEVHKIQSLNPPTIVAHMDLYMSIMFGKSPLRRYQREMIAVVVSAANQCNYCIQHHAEALLHFWKDSKKVDLLATDFGQIDLPALDIRLCTLARQLTLAPNFDGKKGLLSNLKNLGLSDRGILDATLIIAYFNFVNRLVLGLGVELEENPGGYEYE